MKGKEGLPSGVTESLKPVTFMPFDFAHESVLQVCPESSQRIHHEHNLLINGLTFALRFEP